MAFPSLRHGIFRNRLERARRGAIAVLACLLMIVMLGVIAFALDLGMLMVARTELQRSADAAAMAAACDLATEDSADLRATRARRTAEQFAGKNAVRNASPSVDVNTANSAEGDIVVGTFVDFGDPDGEFVVSESGDVNAVKVRIRRNSQINGEVPFSFARVFGLKGRAAEATATAAVIRQVAGFRTPESKANLPILPIAVDEQAWKALLEDGNGTDDWYDRGDGTVMRGSDDVPELALYPESNSSPGNFGTVDIGAASNSTSDLNRQILDGISEADLGRHGGELKLNEGGVLTLDGDTGISAGIKESLKSITGQTRILPVYRSVTGSGDTAQYSIVKFVGVRIMSVDLGGNEKAVYVQPALVTVRGSIASNQPGTSEYVYSPVVLVR